MTDPQDKTYIHGHHPSVLTSHSSRTLANSAAYLLPYLEPYKASSSSSSSPTRILDAGCGPGTITCDIAALLPGAQVTGIDYLLQETCAPLAASRGLTNVHFQESDICKLPFPNDSFDVVHVHQVLQHLPTPPTRAVAELLRVCKSGGVIAVREADFGAFTFHPSGADALARTVTTAGSTLDRWREVYIATARAAGGDPFAGRKLQRWFMDAGVQRADIVCSASCWTYSTSEERRWWGVMWAERTLKSSFAEQAVRNGVVAGEDELKQLAAAWEAWAAEEDGWLMVPSGEVVVRVRKD
ncbi:hypothetical protein DRE_01862 [Drechslerella stenobrocha 248]|uniref:Methyltransferase type 11 domain-containing protein n=1 Tax=Drechslerella stenobrocha 248 TaxID=1043628 RepID=W7IHC5_9PEZI|nr:hypothetical protein DRE_01862 [Drechslerella stenobrocha 248]